MKKLISISALTITSFLTIACGVDIKQKVSEVVQPVQGQSIISFGVVTLVNGKAKVSYDAVCTPGQDCNVQLTNCGVNKSTGLGILVALPGDQLNGVSQSGFVIASTSSLDQSTICWKVNQ